MYGAPNLVRHCIGRSDGAHDSCVSAGAGGEQDSCNGVPGSGVQVSVTGVDHIKAHAIGSAGNNWYSLVVAVYPRVFSVVGGQHSYSKISIGSSGSPGVPRMTLSNAGTAPFGQLRPIGFAEIRGRSGPQSVANVLVASSHVGGGGPEVGRAALLRRLVAAGRKLR